MTQQNSLVNCHTHLELSWMADICPELPGAPFTDWIGGLVMRRRELYEKGGEDKVIFAAIEAGIQALQAAGTTHVGDITQSGLSVEPLLDSGLAGVVYIEVIGLDEATGMESFERARALLEKHRPHERNGMRIGLSPHAPYSTCAGAFEAAVAYSLREAVPLCIHAAESPYENQFLRHGTGPFRDLMRQMGIDTPYTPPGRTTLDYLDTLGVLETRPLLVHMIHASDEELDLVARRGARVAHCPRSNERLQCGRMPLEKLLARDIPVALGTDGLCSSPSLDVCEEAAAAARLHQDHLPPTTLEPLLSNTAIFD